MIHLAFGADEASRPCVLYENVFAEGATNSSASQSGFSVDNALDGTTYTYWRPAPTTFAAWVEGTQNIIADTAAIAAHDLADHGATVDVQVGGGSTWETIATHTPDDNGPIMMIFPRTIATGWRVRIIANGQPSIGVLMLGKRLIWRAGILDGYTPMQWGARVEGLGGSLMGGQMVGTRIIRRSGEGRLPFSSIDREWFEANAANFTTGHFDQFRPFFFAGNPQRRAHDLAYCRRPLRGSEARPQYIEGGELVSLSLDVEYHVEA